MHQPPPAYPPPHDGPVPHPPARPDSPTRMWAPQTPPSPPAPPDPPAEAQPVRRRLAVVPPGPAPMTIDVEKHALAVPPPAGSPSPPPTSTSTPDADVAEPPGEGRPGLHQRLRAAAAEAAGELRFVSERPNSLLDHLAYARSAEWTTEIDGQRRHLALLYVWLVAIPISTLAYLAVWASGQPGRFGSMLAVALLAGTALDAIPVIGWFVPDWASLTYWPPLAWL